MTADRRGRGGEVRTAGRTIVATTVRKRGTVARARWASARPALVGVVALLVVGAAGSAYRWATATPPITNPCHGVLDPEDRDRLVPLTVVRSPDGSEEHRVPVTRDGRVALFLCPVSATDVEIVDLRLPIRTEQHSLLRPDTPHAVDLGPSGPELADAPALQPYRLGPDRPARQVALLFRFDDCAWFAAGGSLGFDRAEVEYRYRGRQRTASIPFGVRYAFVSPADAECPERASVPPPTGPPALETDSTKKPPT